jgi:hypothetical protein
MLRSAAILALTTTAAAVAGCGGAATGPAPPAGPAPIARPAPDPARTQDLVALTTAQAARMADRIALVTARGSRVVEGAPGTPFTCTTFAVEKVVKGRLPRRFVLQVIGGRLGNRVVTSPVPAFAPSARYVLFLGPDNRVGPTIIPQATLEIADAAGAHAALSKIRRYVRTTGGSP